VRTSNPNMAFYMIAIINGPSLFGRLLPGMLTDRYGSFNIMILVTGASGLICCCWTKATSMAGIIALSAAYGFTSGVSFFKSIPYDYSEHS